MLFIENIRDSGFEQRNLTYLFYTGAFFFISAAHTLKAEKSSEWFHPVLGTQFVWQRNLHPDTDQAEFKRFRFGARGHISGLLSYNLIFHADKLGTSGKDFTVRPWTAYFSVNPFKNNTLLHINIGYFRAAASREYFTSPFSISSMDKFLANRYLRYFVSGQFSGMAPGAGLSGIINLKNLDMNYRIGVFLPENKLVQNSESACLKTCHIYLSFPAQADQVNNHQTINENSPESDFILEIGTGGSVQNNFTYIDIEEDTLSNILKTSIGIDGRIYLQGFSLSCESYFLRRGGSHLFDSKTVSFRANYSIRYSATLTIQPGIQYSNISEKTSARENTMTNMKEAGLNFWIRQELKLGFYYTSYNSSEFNYNMLTAMMQVILK